MPAPERELDERDAEGLSDALARAWAPLEEDPDQRPFRFHLPRVRVRIPWAAVAWVASGLLLLCGTAVVVGVLTAAPAPPPRPSLAAAPRLGGDRSVPAAEAAAPAGPSLPVTVLIGAIGVIAEVKPVGTAPDGTIDVPPPEPAGVVGWYSQGPTPGEAGNAVIVGHVDSRTNGPGVFYELGRLAKGDEIRVGRADGSTGRFRVDGVAAFPKAAVPADQVYGPTTAPGLRLITCGGDWTAAGRSYADNVVVFATLVGWERPAGGAR
jgi:hypothetical protein